MIFLILSLASSKHYITFDVYGTLLNTSPIGDTIKQIALDNGLDQDLAYNTYSNYKDLVTYGEEYMDYDMTIKNALIWTDIKMNSDCFEKNFDLLMNVTRNFEPFPEVIDALKEMIERNYTIVIMSNSMASVMDYNREALDDLFDLAILAEESKAYKPQLKFFQYVHDKLDFDHNNHTHIAEGYWSDISPAIKMNWENRILVNRENLKYSDLYPCTVVSTLDEALQYLPPVDPDSSDDIIINTDSNTWIVLGIIFAIVALVALVVVIIFALKFGNINDLTEISSIKESD